MVGDALNLQEMVEQTPSKNMKNEAMTDHKKNPHALLVKTQKHYKTWVKRLKGEVLQGFPLSPNGHAHIAATFATPLVNVDIPDTVHA